jgi:hypothetical protein
MSGVPSSPSSRPRVSSLSTARGVLAGAQPLFRKEVLRFWKVAFQTVAAPVLTAVMYLVVFGHALGGRAGA